MGTGTIKERARRAIKKRDHAHYDPPTPWYRHVWFYAVVGSVVAASVGVTVYELTIAPPDTVSGKVSVH